MERASDSGSVVSPGVSRTWRKGAARLLSPRQRQALQRIADDGISPTSDVSQRHVLLYAGLIVRVQSHGNGQQIQWVITDAGREALANGILPSRAEIAAIHRRQNTGLHDHPEYREYIQKPDI